MPESEPSLLLRQDILSIMGSIVLAFVVLCGKGLSTFDKLLSGVLPDEKCPADMHVEGADDSLLRYFYAHV